MPIIEQNPAWSGILSGLITAYGMSQGMKNAKQEKQRQAQIDADTHAYTMAQTARDIAGIEQSGYSYDPATGKVTQTPVALSPQPKGTSGTPAVQGIVKGRHVIKKPAQPGTGPTNAQMADWALQASIALAGTRPDLAATYRQIADSYNTGAYRQAETTDTLKGKLPKEQAETANIRGLFSHQMQMLDERGRQMLQAAYQRRLAAGSRGGGNSQERAMYAAMNDMERTQYGAQIRGMWDAYNQQQADYRASGGTTPVPQTPNITNIPMSIFFPGQNNQPQQKTLNTPSRIPAAQAVANGRKAGLSEGVMRKELQQGGYSQAEINAALGQQKGSGWGGI